MAEYVSVAGEDIHGRLDRITAVATELSERAEKYRAERDAWHAEARDLQTRIKKLRESRDGALTLCAEIHEAYHQAEAERNTLNREIAALQLELEESQASADRAARYRTERDGWHAQARERAQRIEKLRESLEDARNLRDEYHEAYHAAENERNTLARENAALRSELAFTKESAALRGDALILRLAVPGGDR